MTFPPPHTQPELDLEFPTYDHYTVTISKGAIGDMEVVRTFNAKESTGALDLIEGLRETYVVRDNVTWQDQEMPESGALYGLAPHGIVWEITVVPPLGTLS